MLPILTNQIPQKKTFVRHADLGATSQYKLTNLITFLQYICTIPMYNKKLIRFGAITGFIIMIL